MRACVRSAQMPARGIVLKLVMWNPQYMQCDACYLHCVIDRSRQIVRCVADRRIAGWALDAV
jgi:hypothetical protein